MVPALAKSLNFGKNEAEMKCRVLEGTFSPTLSKGNPSNVQVEPFTFGGKWFGEFIFFSQLFEGFLEVNHAPHSERRNSGRHLGLDIAMPEEGDFAVLCPEEQAKVFHSFHDRSEFNGWGGRVILELQNEFQSCKYLILGHLDPKSLPKIGKKFKKGEQIAQLALLNDSGSWFRHLHVQFCSELHLKFFPLATGEIEELDGYCHDLDEDVSLLTSDPTKYLFY
jgi:hypothetical protein